MTLIEIGEMLQETGAAIAKIEPSLREHPNRPSLLMTLRSLTKRREQLEGELLQTADRLGQDVCAYRIIPDESSRTTISAFSTALADFQNLFSVVYDSIKNGPKDRARLSAEVAEETAFGFAYTFAGSIGTVFTLANDRLLPGIKTNVDTAIDTIFRIARSTEVGEIASFAREIGKPPIRSTYTWAKDHVQYGLGASIEWRQGGELKNSLLAQRQELERLERTIASSSEEKTEEVVIYGTLEAADVRRHTFRIFAQEGGDIRGRFDDAISDTHVVTIPTRYTATLSKTTKTLYSTETEETSYFLQRLE